MVPHPGVQAAEAPSANQLAYLANLISELKGGLDRKNFGHIRETFRQIAACPSDLEGVFEDVEAAFSALNREGLLIDLMLEGRPGTLSSLHLIEKCLILGAKSRREDAVLNAIDEILKAPNSMRVAWDATTRMSAAKQFGKDISRKFSRLKYLGVSLAPGELFQTADALAERIRVPKILLDKLHTHTRFQGVPRDEWDRQVRTAFAIDHVTKDFVAMSGGNVGHWLGQEQGALAQMRDQVDQRLSSLDRSKGVLLATFHGGFSRLTLALFQQLFPNGMTVLGGAARAKSGDDRFIRVVGNERAALFQALRAVQDGKALWIGPDAPFGSPKQSIEVLGVNVPVADGGPFVAYETKCPTVWMSLVRSGKGFSVTTELGPVREAGEKYSAFKGRWFAFYGRCIENFLTGDPCNLSLRPHWMHYLSGHIPKTYYLGEDASKVSRSESSTAEVVDRADNPMVPVERRRVKVKRQPANRRKWPGGTPVDWI
jgi:hypothetical protein